ncbi:MAG: energy coupling factor transporter S component ThiW [Johnsonella sp.]|nr:energy coupling factor transporter S component ThiW [Johnsonella sp.]
MEAKNKKEREIKMPDIKRLALAAIFSAVSIIGSLYHFPIFGSKCAPVQHMVNILSAVFLGPYYALASAFCTSVIRNLLGIGTLLAFPGSMPGAFLAGLLYQRTKTLSFAYLGEIIGTALIGGILSYPIAYFIIGNRDAAIFTFVLPFLISTAGGTLIALLITKTMEKTGMLQGLKKELKA